MLFSCEYIPAISLRFDYLCIGIFRSPAGWDNIKKISILYENMHSCKPDDYYRDIIVQPITRKTVSSKEDEVEYEDYQAFLARMQKILLAGGGMAPNRTADTPIRAAGIGKPSPRTPGTPGMQGSPKKVNYNHNQFAFK